MKQQEMRELLEEQLYCAQTIRAVQAQFLAESDREAETKRHFRQCDLTDILSTRQNHNLSYASLEKPLHSKQSA